MCDTYAVEDPHLIVDAAFLRHIKSKVEEKRKRLSCIAEKKRSLLQRTVQTDTSLAQKQHSSVSRICSLHMCNAQSIMHFIRNL